MSVPLQIYNILKNNTQTTTTRVIHREIKLKQIHMQEKYVWCERTQYELN